MKKISLILLLFLLPLCLIPPTGAVYGDESPDSITSFSETLPDDLMYFPDSFGAGIIELADYGEISDESSSPDYILTHVKDGSAFNETTATDLEIWFEVDTTDGFEGFSYAHFLDVDSGTDVDLAAYDFNQDFFVKIDEPLPSTYDWMNGTIYDPDYWNTTHIAFSMYELSGTADLYWDYGEITLHRMTLADSDHYAEGFNDVSDWVFDSESAGLPSRSFTSDGDVLTFEIGFDDAGQEFAQYDFALTGLSVTDYLEILFFVVDTTGAYKSTRFTLILDAVTILSEYPTDWVTRKIYVDDYLDVAPTNLILKIDDLGNSHASLTGYMKADYIRIGPANESGGWQHDGSTIAGITESVDADISSNGDTLNVTATSVSEYIQFDVDTTATQAVVDFGYYQFLEFSISQVYDDRSDGGVWGWVQGVDSDSSTEYISSGYVDDTGVFRYNLAALTLDDLESVRIYLQNGEHGDWFTVDWMKAYSIANWTVTQHASSNVNDILYVDSGSLVSDKSAGTSVHFLLWLDPTISVSDTYTVWNFTVSNIGSDQAGVYDWTQEAYVSGWNELDRDETRGAMPTGTVTDYRFYIRESLTVSAIKFIDTRDWQEIGEVEFVIPVGWDPTFIFGYDAFFIFLGLILIPVSTMYLVRGGREEASADKVFYFLIMFMIGFGLLVGGIMP